MIVALNNLPDGEQKFLDIISEQLDLMEHLKEIGAFDPNFSFEVIDPKVMY